MASRKMANIADFLDAAYWGNLPRVQKMLADGDARITDTGRYEQTRETALLKAAKGDPRSLPTLKWLLIEGGARITERDRKGNTALLLAAERAALTGCSMVTCLWLLEHGGADIAEETDLEISIWDMLSVRRLLNVHPLDAVVGEAMTMLRAMVVRGAPPAEFMARLRRPEHARVVEEGARLRAALPAYLVRRRAILDAHCPLIAPLLALVRGYDPEPTTTEELWATGLCLAP
jgi:hypothetical protein